MTSDAALWHQYASPPAPLHARPSPQARVSPERMLLNRSRAVRSQRIFSSATGAPIYAARATAGDDPARGATARHCPVRRICLSGGAQQLAYSLTCTSLTCQSTCGGSSACLLGTNNGTETTNSSADSVGQWLSRPAYTLGLRSRLARRLTWSRFTDATGPGSGGYQRRPGWTNRRRRRAAPPQAHGASQPLTGGLSGGRGSRSRTRPLRRRSPRPAHVRPRAAAGSRPAPPVQPSGSTRQSRGRRPAGDGTARAVGCATARSRSQLRVRVRGNRG